MNPPRKNQESQSQPTPPVESGNEGLSIRMDALDQRMERIAIAIEAIEGQLARLSELLVSHANAQEQRSQSIDSKLDRIATALEGHVTLANQQSQAIAALTNLASQLLARTA